MMRNDNGKDELGDDEKPLIQNLKFHVINRQLNKFKQNDVTV